MKSFSLLLVFAAMMLRGADAPLPEFNSNLSGVPPLSLGEMGKGAVKPMPFGEKIPSFCEPPADGLLGNHARPSIARGVPSNPPRFTQKSAPGNMPILEPNPNIDYRIVLKEPDPTVDFKMLIRPPETTQKQK
jgi:hypothetical protein